MDREQRWNVETTSGEKFQIITLGGLGPVQAVHNAGMMMKDVLCITAEGIALTEDIAAWREGRA